MRTLGHGRYVSLEDRLVPASHRSRSRMALAPRNVHFKQRSKGGNKLKDYQIDDGSNAYRSTVVLEYYEMNVS